MTQQMDWHPTIIDTGDDQRETGPLPSQASDTKRHQQQIRQRRTRARRVMQLNRRR